MLGFHIFNSSRSPHENFPRITVTSWWTRWRLKWTVSPLFTQQFIRVQIKENIKAPRHWPLCVEFTGDRWIPRSSVNSPHRWPATRNMLPFDDVIKASTNWAIIGTGWGMSAFLCQAITWTNADLLLLFYSKLYVQKNNYVPKSPVELAHY